MKLRYIMLLQIKENPDAPAVLKAVRLPECEDDSTECLYKVLSHFASKNWVNLCGVIPGFDCGCLPEKDVEIWKKYLVEYDEIF